MILMNGFCGKCKTRQNMEVRTIEKEVTYYCPNCKDQISKNICKMEKELIKKLEEVKNE